MLSETLAALLAISLAMSAIGGVVTLSAVTSASENVVREQQDVQGAIAALLKQAVALSDAPPSAAGSTHPLLTMGETVRFHCDHTRICALSSEAATRGVKIRLMEGEIVRATAVAPPGSVLMAYKVPPHGDDESLYLANGIGIYDQSNARAAAFVRITAQLSAACRYDPTSYACVLTAPDGAP